MTTVDGVWFNAGADHRAATQALAEALAIHTPQWTVRRVHPTEALDPLAMFPRSLGFEPEDLTNKPSAPLARLAVAPRRKTASQRCQ
jgi:hypothetical protein